VRRLLNAQKGECPLFSVLNLFSVRRRCKGPNVLLLFKGQSGPRLCKGLLSAGLLLRSVLLPLAEEEGCSNIEAKDPEEGKFDFYTTNSKIIQCYLIDSTE
jgi:hypothetical protein